jgi:hypothetical protein
MPGDERDAIVEAARAAPSVRGMVNWLRYPSYHVEPLEDGWRVTIHDVRYSRAGQSDSPIGTAVVELDSSLNERPSGGSS